jgi:hypothetical protein
MAKNCQVASTLFKERYPSFCANFTGSTREDNDMGVLIAYAPKVALFVEEFSRVYEQARGH